MTIPILLSCLQCCVLRTSGEVGPNASCVFVVTAWVMVFIERLTALEVVPRDGHGSGPSADPCPSLLLPR